LKIISRVMNKTSLGIYTRVSIAMPTELLQRLDEYCRIVMRDEPKIRSAVVRQAIEEFLYRQGKKLGRY